MKAHLTDTHLVPRSRSSAKVKVKYQGHVSQKMGVSGALVFHKHILFLLQVLCWGVRNMKKFQMSSVTSPSIEFEVSGNVLESSVIKSTKRNPNFSEPHIVFDVVRLTLILTFVVMYLCCGECRVRSACTYVQSDIALHAPLFYY